MSICLGLQETETNVEIKLLAIKALNDSLSFMESYFAKKVRLNFTHNVENFSGSFYNKYDFYEEYPKIDVKFQINGMSGVNFVQ